MFCFLFSRSRYDLFLDASTSFIKSYYVHSRGQGSPPPPPLGPPPIYTYSFQFLYYLYLFYSFLIYSPYMFTSVLLKKVYTKRMNLKLLFINKVQTFVEKLWLLASLYLFSLHFPYTTYWPLNPIRCSHGLTINSIQFLYSSLSFSYALSLTYYILIQLLFIYFFFFFLF